MVLEITDDALQTDFSEGMHRILGQNGSPATNAGGNAGKTL